VERFWGGVLCGVAGSEGFHFVLSIDSFAFFMGLTFELPIGQQLTHEE